MTILNSSYDRSIDRYTSKRKCSRPLPIPDTRWRGPWWVHRWWHRCMLRRKWWAMRRSLQTIGGMLVGRRYEAWRHLRHEGRLPTHVWIWGSAHLTNGKMPRSCTSWSGGRTQPSTIRCFPTSNGHILGFVQVPNKGYKNRIKHYYYTLLT